MLQKKTVVKAESARREFAKRLMAVVIGTWVWEMGLEKQGKKWQEAGRVLDEMLAEAKKRGYEELVEKRRGKLVPAGWLYDQVEEMIEEFEDDMFWERLETDLAHRDLEENHGEDLKKMGDEKKADLHDRYHEKWAQEFEKNGLKRLDIIDNVPSVRTGRVRN